MSRLLPVVLLLALVFTVEFPDSQTTNLVVLAHSSQACSTSATDDRLASHRVVVHLWKVVELVLEWLTSSVFALVLTRNLTYARDGVQDSLKVVVGQRFFTVSVGDRASFELSGKIIVNGGQRHGMNS